MNLSYQPPRLLVWKALVLVCMILLCAQTGKATLSKEDSLRLNFEQQFAISDTSEALLQATYELVRAYFQNQPDSSIKYLKFARQTAIKRGNTLEIIHAGRTLGTSLNYLGKPDIAIQYFQEVWFLLKKEGMEESTIPVLSDFAGTYYNAGYFEAAKRYRLMMLKLIYKFHHPKTDIMAEMANLGFTYMELAKMDTAYYDSAYFFFHTGLAISKQSSDPLQEGIHSDYMGLFQLERNNWESAKTRFHTEIRVLSELQEAGDPRLNVPLFLGRGYYGLARAFQGSQEPDSVIKYAVAAKAIWQTMEKDIQYIKITKSNLLLAEAYQQTGANHLAQVHLDLVETQVEKLDLHPESQVDIYGVLAQLYAKQDNFKFAYWARDKQDQINQELAQKTNDWHLFANHSEVVGSLISLRLAKQVQESESIRRTRNLSIGGVITVSLLLCFLLFLMTKLRSSNRINRENSEQLARLNQSKDKLMSVLGHDLRAPFNSLMGISGQLSQQVEDQKWQRAKASTRIIQQASQEAYYLFEDLLGWAKSQTGQLPYDPKPLELASLLRDTLAVLNGMASAKQIKIQTDIDHSWATGDPLMVRTIFRNLIGNAIKFSPPAGTILITIQERGEKLQITVQDDGPGLTPTEIQAIQSGMVSSKGNHGLGLVLCKEFAAEHGGELRIESTPDLPTRFVFFLQKRTAPADTDTSVFQKILPTPSESDALTGDWKMLQQDTLVQFKGLKVYQSSRVKQLLRDLDDDAHPELARWKNQVSRAVDEFNEAEFDRLTRLG